MPKVKTLFVVLLVITFSFSLLGCGLITSRTASTDEVVETGGQIPEWLLLSHRNIASEESDVDDELAAIDEDEEEKDVSAESGQTEQATSEVAQAAETGSSESTQQEQTSSDQQQESSGGSTFDDMVAKMVPGNPEYNYYLQHRKDRNETPEEFLRRALKAKEEAEKEESKGSMMDGWNHSPSGWGESDDGG